ncbi:Major Facilitator Superfamily (MFS) [Phytophthora palmivora]|uniref:Major Facilitator Superfamily (MFS) n=1 Tax=Phytophthora palmivora TaxID=4796 RepID=A0A2P4Y5F7_9STRA|nr:Major Facilitator Superfamily (MFS) [Phytophthora palmivora]
MTRDSQWSQALPFIIASSCYFIGMGVAITLPAAKHEYNNDNCGTVFENAKVDHIIPVRTPMLDDDQSLMEPLLVKPALKYMYQTIFSQYPTIEMDSSTDSPPHKLQRKRNVGCALSAIVGLQVLTAGAFGIMSPIISIVMTEYFARLHRDGSLIDCGANPHDEACTVGSRQAAWLSSIFSAVGCVGNLILAPMLGQASDVYGRKPFLVLSQVVRVATPFSVMYFMEPGGSITPYFMLRLIDSGFGTAGVMSAAIADVVAPEDRTAAFGVLFASLSVGYCISAFIAPFFSREHILQIAGGLFIMRVLWAFFILPETLPIRSRMSKARWVMENPVSSMAILFRNQLFMRLTCLIALTSFVMNGVFQIQSFFLNTIVGFNVKDFGNLMLLGGVLALLGQVLLLKPLVACVREKGVLVIALIASMMGTCGFVVIAYYPRKWLVYAMSIPGCISDLSFPAISALKSINVSEQVRFIFIDD